MFWFGEIQCQRRVQQRTEAIGWFRVGREFAPQIMNRLSRMELLSDSQVVEDQNEIVVSVPARVDFTNIVAGICGIKHQYIP